jgi:DNA primase
MFTQESLENLRQRIDLVDLLSSHIDLKRSGAFFKACCPFHEEKTPSFMVKRGDSHYHCFGCGAHGDAIAFLMNHVRMGFAEAVESLAERFGVTLVKTDEPVQKGPSRVKLKEVLESACQFYHFLLLHSEEGHEALAYLYSRGIDLAFIARFQIGLAPKVRDSHLSFAKEKGFDFELLEQTGLAKMGERGKPFDFFSDRILFPIRDPMGAVIGFSGRKFREETHGGKYVNTPETPLFKKSHVLFGLSYSRKRIAKERRAIIVEGQIDALRLIESGFDYAVAGQGTAFGDGHVAELMQLGITEVYLALDSDSAGQEAAFKIGDLFQKKGVSVKIAILPKGSDPDSFLKDYGPEAFEKLLNQATDYLQFAFSFRAQAIDLENPAHKSALLEELTKKIRAWEHPVMVFETLRELSKLAKVPEEMLGIQAPQAAFIRKVARTGGLQEEVDGTRILEVDLLRWALLSGPHQQEVLKLISTNISLDSLRHIACHKILQLCFKEAEEGRTVDLLRLGSLFEEKEDPRLFSELLAKKINLQKPIEGCKGTIKNILEKAWLDEMEQIKMKIQSGSLNDEEAIELAKRYAEIRKTPPVIKE